MSFTNPLVSVVIPVYNSEASIERCLDSVVGQTYPHLEIIVVNDGSKDRSLDRVRNFVTAKMLQNVVIIDQENKGVSAARNAGMKKASGYYIAFLDSDDAWYENKTEKQLKILKDHPDIDLIAADHTSKPIKRFFLKKFGSVTEIKVTDLAFKNFLQPSTVILKRSILNFVGYFDESQHYAEEGNFFMRISHQYKCVLMAETLIDYGCGKAGFGESGLSSNIFEMEKGELKNLSYAYKNGYINYPVYFIAKLFSLAKYLRRVLIVKLK